MKTKLSGRTVLLLTAAAFLLLPAAAQQESAKQLFEKALHLEETKGDLESAIAVYKRITAESPDERDLAAQSFYHLGLCYEKLGMRDAQRAYQNVIEKYPDQAATVRMAREKLTALAGARAASLKSALGLSIQKVWSGRGVDSMGDISPDGRQYCFTDWETGDLAVRELASGKNRRISDKGPWSNSYAFALFPKWSPDGRSIAYCWFDSDPAQPQGGHFELRLIGLEEAQPRILYEHKVTPAADVFPFDWHPNGERILVYIGRQPDTYELAFVSVADKSVQAVKEFKGIGGGSGVPWNFVISPDGRIIAYDRAPQDNPKNRDIFLLSTDGKNEKRLFDHPATDQVCAWTADGRNLLFGSDRTGEMGLWIVPVREGKELEAPRLLKADMGPFNSIGNTGQDQFFYSYSKEGRDIYLGEVDPASGRFMAPPIKQVRLFEGRNAMPEFSPDGRSFLYVSSRGRGPRTAYSLCISSLDTGEIREVETGQMKFGFFSFPQWRPDGRAISLYGKDSQGRSGIHVIDVESGGVSPLVLTGENESVYSHRWSVDGRVLFYTKGEPRKSLSIYVHDQKTGRESVLPGSPDDAQYIDVSPDGKWLAFLNGGLEKKLSIMPTEGGVPRESHAFQVSGQFFITPAWSADGKYIYFSSRVNPGDEEWDMWRFSLEERQVQKIELNSVSFRHPSLHPDGRRMIFSTEKTNAVDSEVWMMENFLPMAKAQK